MSREVEINSRKNIEEGTMKLETKVQTYVKETAVNNELDFMLEEQEEEEQEGDKLVYVCMKNIAPVIQVLTLNDTKPGRMMSDNQIIYTEEDSDCLTVDSDDDPMVEKKF